MKRHEEMLNGKTNRTTLNIPQNTTEKGKKTKGLYFGHNSLLNKQNMAMIMSLYFFDIAVKMITMMPQIESDSVIADQEDSNEKGNYHA